MLSSLPALKGSGAYLEDINHCLYLLHVHHRVWGLYGFIDKTVPINLPCRMPAWESLRLHHPADRSL